MRATTLGTLAEELRGLSGNVVAATVEIDGYTFEIERVGTEGDGFDHALMSLTYVLTDPTRAIPPGSDCLCGRYQDESHREHCKAFKIVEGSPAATGEWGHGLDETASCSYSW